MTNKNILIVEDEKIVAEDLKETVEGWGYQVLSVVASSEKAIEKIAETTPDLVLMDIRIKGSMDGIETAEYIQSRFNIPIVYITAYADKNTVEQAQATKPLAFILKPFDERELQSTLKTL